MDCPSCGHSNGEGTRFCGDCGGSLTVAVICPACGAENTEAGSFCTACGQSLGDSDRAARASTIAVLGNLVERDPGAYTPGHLAEKILGARGELEGERKQVTVMFVDIVGSMDLARALNPERWLELLERFLELACGAVHRFEGTVDKFTGDGVMALFGAPLAHEDHARRACLAALALQDRVSPFAESLEQERIDFAVRTGLNSGEVIVGEIGDRGQMSYTAIGHTVGVAQRMESLAPPGSTALSVTTASLVAGEFDLNELGEFEVRGSGAPERVLQLAGRAVSRDRVEAASARGGLSPFVGRAGEQVKLKAALELARAGDGQVLGIVGEPGVGKSRLAHEFVEDCAARGIAAQRARALSHGREVPLMPVLELWRSTLGVGEADEPAAARERIEESLEVLDPSFGEDLPVIFDFLGVPDPERPTPKMDPEARQRLLLALVRRLVHARSHLQVGLIVIEDLHWLDDASGLFLAELVRAAAGTRTLLILTYRPEYVARVLSDRHGVELALRPLDQAAVGQLLASLMGNDPSLDGLTEMIASRAVGNPFFCEELVAALADSGHLVGRRGSYRLARTLEEIVLPATVQATLADRIDRLAERERELVQVASVIGQELSAELLGAVSGISDGELSASLHALVASEHLIERDGEAGGQYAFKHPLTQEVAYWSQLSDRRRRVHREAALAIDELYPDRLDELAALVGHHYEAAGDALAAADHYTRAATWMGYSDIVQARAHWQRVASLVKTVPESPKANVLACIAHQGELQCGWRLGMSEQEAEEHYRAGRELALRIGDSASLLGITGFYSVLCGLSGRVREYDELAEEADRLSLEIGIPALRMAIIVSTMFARWVRGRLRDALALAEEGIAIGAEDPTLGAGLSLTCPFAFSHLIKGMALNMMGRPEQAKSAFERALALAQEHGDLETAGYAKQNFALVAWTTGRMTESERSLAAEALDNAQRTGSSQARVQALACLGIAHLGLGQVDQAIPAFERSVKLALETRTGHEVLPMWQAGLVDALLLAGEHATALDTARDALARAERYGTEAWLPTCHRALADALLASGESDAAAAARQALESAVAAMTVTGARYELPFIERTQEKLAPVI